MVGFWSGVDIMGSHHQAMLMTGTGSSGPSVSITDHYIFDDGASAGGAGLARLWLFNDGTAGYETNWADPTDGLFSGEWLVSGNVSDCEARATVTSGTLSGGTSGSWLSLSSSLSWTRLRAINGVSTCIFTLEIRRTSDSTVLDTSTITLEASGSTGGDPCVVANSWMSWSYQAVDIREGMLMMTYDPSEGFRMLPVQKVRAKQPTQCVRITTTSGASLSCSVSTPFNLRSATRDCEDGHWKYAPEMLGEYVLVERNNSTVWEKVESIVKLGKQEVIPISFGGRSFAAGDHPSAKIYSHNMAKAIP